MPVYLKIKLLSDTAFGRGDGVAGVVDNEIEHDVTTGLPIIKGRTVKGLVVEACANILFGLSKFSNTAHDLFAEAASDMFGLPGSDLDSDGWLHFGPATLPADLVLRIKQHGFSRQEILNVFTDIRRQTASDPTRDTPLDSTLRATRGVVREMIFHAPVSSIASLGDVHQALLAACANTVRLAGHNRTRGLGWLQVTLEDAGNADYVALFETMVQEAIS
jgi:hypothetical protein